VTQPPNASVANDPTETWAFLLSLAPIGEAIRPTCGNLVEFDALIAGQRARFEAS